MRFQDLILVGTAVTQVSAFYIYEAPQSKKVENPSVADHLSFGFSFSGKEGATDRRKGLGKHINLKKKHASSTTSNHVSRAINEVQRLRTRWLSSEEQSTKTKRVNDYEISAAAPPSKANSAGINQDGTDYSYFAEMTFGDKGDTFYMLLDTGSGDSWVMSPGCDSDACTSHSTFGPDNSGTLVESSKEFKIGYGTGNVQGTQGTDTVELAGIKVPLTLGLATYTSDQFNNYPMDGILALGRQKQNQMGVKTFMSAVMDAKLLKANIFGVALNRAGDGENDGEINFGEPDSSRYDGDLTYSDCIADESTWEIPADDIIVGGKAVGATGYTAIMDTGTSYMLLPPDAAKKLFDAIPGAQGTGEIYNVPCDTTTSIELSFSKVAYTISPADYVGSEVGSGMCQTHIIAATVAGANRWLLGDTFLKNVYTVFDLDQNRIGIGAKSASKSTSTTSSTSSSSSLSPSTSPLSTSSTGSTSPATPPPSLSSPSSSSSSPSSSPSGTSSSKTISSSPPSSTSASRTIPPSSSDSSASATTPSLIIPTDLASGDSTTTGSTGGSSGSSSGSSPSSSTTSAETSSSSPPGDPVSQGAASSMARPSASLLVGSVGLTLASLAIYLT